MAAALRREFSDAAGHERVRLAQAMLNLDPADRLWGIRLLRDLATDPGPAPLRLRSAALITDVVPSRAVRVVAVLVPHLDLGFDR